LALQNKSYVKGSELEQPMAWWRRSWVGPVACLLAAGAPQAGAATFAVDDSASRIEMLASARGAGGTIGRPQVDNHVRVDAVLDMRPWVGRSGRVYLVLPPQPLASLRMQWRTHGRLRPGQLTGGQRALVYEGPINAPLLQDRMDFTVQVDGRELLSTQRLNLRFEIELP
jgi:hypothetical protein